VSENTDHQEPEARPALRRRRSQRRTLALSTVLATVLGGGGALASGAPPAPAADDVVLRSPASTLVHTGTTVVDLGNRPAGVTSVDLTLTCLSPGTLTLDDAGPVTCAPGDVAAPGLPGRRDSNAGFPHGGRTGYTLALTEGVTSTTVTATHGTRWSLTTAYATLSDWAVNADGQTYGTPREDGSAPDLIAVATATRTGEQGYVRNTDLKPPVALTSPQEVAQWWASQPPVRIFPLYASDGTTVLGAFQAGPPG
jgi:hypothetical protein